MPIAYLYSRLNKCLNSQLPTAIESHSHSSTVSFNSPVSSGCNVSSGVTSVSPSLLPLPTDPASQSSPAPDIVYPTGNSDFSWRKLDGKTSSLQLSSIYDEVVHWRRTFSSSQVVLLGGTMWERLRISFRHMRMNLSSRLSL